MLNYRTYAILKREVITQIFSKKFIIMTLAIPLVMLFMIGLQVFIVSYDKQDRVTLHILTESASMQALLSQQLASSEDFADPAFFDLQYAQTTAGGVDAYIEANRPALLQEQLTGIVFIPDGAREDKKIYYYSSNPSNQTLVGQVREQVNRAVVSDYFDKLNVTRDAVAFARSNVTVDGIRITRDGNTTTNIGNLVIAFGFTMFIYISLLSMGPAVMGAVNEEKTNRVVEVLLSSVTSNELMFGKVLGTAAAGLAQMIIWISPMVILSLISLPALVMMNTLDFDISAFNLLYFLVNYLLGLIAFLSIFAAFGAMFDTPQDAQGSIMPVMMLIIIPFLMAFSMARNPANTLAEVSSMLPFASIIVMPARMTLIDVPAWQLSVAMLVNLATIYFCLRIGARIYRITILMTGKRPGWTEIWHWVRYN